MPQGPLGGRAVGQQPVHLGRVLRLLALPLGPRHVRHQAPQLPVRRAVRGEVGLGPGSAGGYGAGLLPPPQLTAADRAGLGTAEAVVQRGAELAHLRCVDEVDPAAVVRAGPAGVQAGARHVHGPLGDAGGGAEAVAAVDRVLGGDQGRHDVAAFTGGGQVPVHHAGEDAPAAVGGADGDVGDGVGGHRRTAHGGDLLGEAAEGRDTTAAVEGAHHPAGLEFGPAGVELGLGGGGLGEEADVHGAVPFRALGLGDGADVDAGGRTGGRSLGAGGHGVTVGPRW